MNSSKQAEQPKMLLHLKMSNDEQEMFKGFKASAQKVGKLYPVLEDFYGNIIDGQHRLEADENWPRIRLENIKTEKAKTIARLISNVCRRSVSALEKIEILGQLGAILLKEGVKRGEISKEIAEATGMSHRWVIKYLPNEYKDPVQSKRRSNSVAHRATQFLALAPKERALAVILQPPRNKEALKISKYANTRFVILTLEKSFYSNFEKDSLELGISPEQSMMKALEEYHSKIKKVISLRESRFERLESNPKSSHYAAILVKST